MSNMNQIYVGLLLAVLVTGPVGSVWANDSATTVRDTQDDIQTMSLADEFSTAQSGSCQICNSNCGEVCQAGAGPWYGGVEYRYIRPSFSEAVAFAVVTDSFGAGFQRQVSARELRFDYGNSARLYIGSHIGDSQDVRISYWNLDMDVSVNGVAGAGQTLVDPFGNLGLAGANISTNASINMNVFDVEYLQTMSFPCQNVDFAYSTGVRFARVKQDYDSTIRTGGGVSTSVGVFTADFDGVGPYFSLASSTSRDRQFSLLAKGGAAVLIGSYQVDSGVTIPGVAAGGQSANRIRAVPIVEGELGGSWHPTDRFTISSGYMVQAWFNLGVSGGTFDGENLPVAPIDTVFGQTDDADIMSFDGFFVRAEYWF